MSAHVATRCLIHQNRTCMFGFKQTVHVVVSSLSFSSKYFLSLSIFFPFEGEKTATEMLRHGLTELAKSCDHIESALDLAFEEYEANAS